MLEIIMEGYLPNVLKQKKREKVDLEASISAISTVGGTKTDVSALDNSQAGNSLGGCSERSGRDASDVKTSERRVSSIVRTINSSNIVHP